MTRPGPPTQESPPPTANASLDIQLSAPYPFYDYPSALEGGLIRDKQYLGSGVTPYTLRLNPQVLAAAPSFGADVSITEYSNQLRVDTDTATNLLMEYGQPENRARSLRVAFVDARRLAVTYKVPSNVQVDGWSEPYIIWRKEAEERGPVGYANFIGIPIAGSGDLTENGLARLNRIFIHELGHCANRASQSVSPLYERDSNDNFLPYRNRRVFGVVRVALGVSYLKMRGHSEFSALWQLDPDERKARAFERKHADLGIIALASE